MTMRPGAMKLANGTPSTVRPPRPNATVKIARYSKVVMAGAQTVCIWTLKNRRTSLIYRVLSPPQLTPLSTGSPGGRCTHGAVWEFGDASFTGDAPIPRHLAGQGTPQRI